MDFETSKKLIPFLKNEFVKHQNSLIVLIVNWEKLIVWAMSPGKKDIELDN